MTPRRGNDFAIMIADRYIKMVKNQIHKFNKVKALSFNYSEVPNKSITFFWGICFDLHGLIRIYIFIILWEKFPLTLFITL